MKKRSLNERILLKQILGFITYAIIWTVIIFFVVGVVGNPRKSFFGYTVRIVVSGSMEPEIKTNSLNIIKLCSIEDINVNDVVCFNYSQDIIHRVFEIKTNEDGDIVLHTKGDANEKADDVEVYGEMVIGKVVKTFNGTSELISKYSISPGNIDSLALSKDLISKLAVLGVIIFTAIYIVEIVRIMIISFGKKDSYDKVIDMYIKDIDELIMYKELLKELKEYEVENTSETRFRYLLNKVAKAKAGIEIDKLNSSIKHYKKQVKHCIWLSKLGVKIDNTDNVENN